MTSLVVEDLLKKNIDKSSIHQTLNMSTSQNWFNGFYITHVNGDPVYYVDDVIISGISVLC